SIYSNATERDKKLVNLFVRAGGYPDFRLISTFSTTSSRRTFNPRGCLQKDDPVRALFLNKTIPAVTLRFLESVIPLPQLNTSEYAPTQDDILICRETRATDLATFAVIFKEKGLKIYGPYNKISKAHAANALAVGGWDEICVTKSGKLCAPEKAPDLGCFTITSALYFIAIHIGLFNKVTPEYVDAPYHELAAHGYEVFLRCANPAILPGDLIGSGPSDIITYSKYITDALKLCPVGRFISYDKFDDYLRAKSGGPLSIVDNTIWDECESSSIQFFLSCYCALGMVDLSWRQIGGKSGYVSVTGLRLTNLGAWILGLAKDYEPLIPAQPAIPGSRIVVSPDFTATVNGSKSQLELCPYLSRFFTRKSNGASSTYTLDCEGVFKMLDQEETLESLIQFLVSNSARPMPENVITALRTWYNSTGDAKIRSVQVISSKKLAVLDKISSIEGIDQLVRQVTYLEVRDYEATKALLRKNGYYIK
ncbi:MAG: hypothetical protein LBC41_16070, partial [Clostridiales bacterium]|nr:hypothetical protein [Clostridiales bacterium]